MRRKRLEAASDESMSMAHDRFLVALEEHQRCGWALIPGTMEQYDSDRVVFPQELAKYMVRGIIELDISEESKRILCLRRRALLMELALVEDELGIERSVERKS